MQYLDCAINTTYKNTRKQISCNKFTQEYSVQADRMDVMAINSSYHVFVYDAIFVRLSIMK